MNKHTPWPIFSAPADPRPGTCTPRCRRHVTRCLDAGVFVSLDLTCATHNGPPVIIVRPKDDFAHLPVARVRRKRARRSA